MTDKIVHYYFNRKRKSSKISKYHVNIAMLEIQGSYDVLLKLLLIIIDNESLTKNDEDKYCEINKEPSREYQLNK